MNYDKKKRIWLWILGLSTVIISIFTNIYEVLNSNCCNDTINPFDIILSVLIGVDFLYFLIIDLYDNKRQLSQKGAYLNFETIDRISFCEDIRNELLMKIDENHLIEVDCRNLGNYDCINMIQKVYQNLSEEKKIGKKKIVNINLISSFDMEDFNTRLFYDSVGLRKKQINIYLLDSDVVNPFYVYRISNQLNDLNNLNLKKKEKEMLSKVYIIFFNRF